MLNQHINPCQQMTRFTGQGLKVDGFKMRYPGPISWLYLLWNSSLALPCKAHVVLWVVSVGFRGKGKP